MRALLLSAALLCGCTTLADMPERAAVATDTAVMPATWTEASRATLARHDGVVPATLWAGFDDPDLDALTRAAISSTPDVRAAQARIREARSRVAIAEAARRPRLGASGSAARSRTSGESGIGQIPGIPLIANEYSVGGSATWEPDVWGRLALGVDAAEAGLAAAQSDARAVALSLQSEIGRNYVTLREAQESLAVLRDTLALLEESLRLTDLLVGQELAPEFDRVQIEADIASLRSQAEGLRAQAVTLGYALSVLSGEAPKALDRLLSRPEAGVPSYSAGLPDLLPSELLLRRPDIERARQQLLAADLELAAEDLNRLPSFSLLGEAGMLSQMIDSLIDWDARRWLISAAFDWPVYQGGRLQAQREGAEARVDQAVAAYDGVVLKALGDVEGALERYIAAKRQAGALATAIDRRTRVLDLAEMRYRSGLDSQFRVLEAQRALLDARSAAVAARAREATALIDLNAAIGGSWVDP